MNFIIVYCPFNDVDFLINYPVDLFITILFYLIYIFYVGIRFLLDGTRIMAQIQENKKSLKEKVFRRDADELERQQEPKTVKT